MQLPLVVSAVYSTLKSIERAGVYLMIFLFPVLSSCSLYDKLFDSDYNDVDTAADGFTSTLNIKYGKNAYQGFDLHVPKRQSVRPRQVVVLVHGGGWFDGAKEWLKPTVDSLMKSDRNMVIANINYRLVKDDKKTLLEAQLADMDSCLTFLRRNAAEYNLSEEFVLAGVSAGAHLCLLHAYTHPKIKAVIGVSAYTELSVKSFMDPLLLNRVQGLIGASYGADDEAFKGASPLYIASPTVPATFLLYGGLDASSTLQQGRLLHSRLKVLNVPTSFTVYPNEDHNISAGPVFRAILGYFGVLKP